MNIEGEIYNIINYDRFKYLREIGQVKKILKLKNGSNLKVLDIGCGNGFAAWNFFNYEGIETYIGIDSSEESLDKNIFKTMSNIQCVLLPMNLNEFINEDCLQILKTKFDIILVLGDVLNLIDKKIIPSMLEKFNKILKKSGNLFIEYYDMEELGNINYSKDIYRNESKTVYVEYSVAKGKLTTKIKCNEDSLSITGSALSRKTILNLAKKRGLFLNNSLCLSRKAQIIGNPVEVYSLRNV